jgi:hypothetical protein
MENFVLLAITVMVLLVSPGGSTLEGNWTCSYEIIGRTYSANVTETMNYSSSGTYESIGVSKYKYPDDMNVEIEIHFHGNWKIEDGFLLHEKTDAVVKRTSVDWITVEAAQAELDRTDESGEWTKNSFQISNGILTTRPINPKRPELEITTTCVKA